VFRVRVLPKRLSPSALHPRPPIRARAVPCCRYLSFLVASHSSTRTPRADTTVQGLTCCKDGTSYGAINAPSYGLDVHTGPCLSHWPRLAPVESGSSSFKFLSLYFLFLSALTLPHLTLRPLSHCTPHKHHSTPRQDPTGHLFFFFFLRPFPVFRMSNRSCGLPASARVF
jgi:hypothetical protein